MHLWNQNQPGRVVFRALGTALPQLTDDVLVLTIVVFVVILKNTKYDFLNILFVLYIKVTSWNLKVIIIVFVEVLKNTKDDVLLNSKNVLFFNKYNLFKAFGFILMLKLCTRQSILHESFLSFFVKKNESAYLFPVKDAWTESTLGCITWNWNWIRNNIFENNLKIILC
jgi:hypothetical protein